MTNWDKAAGIQATVVEQTFKLAPGEEASRLEFERLVIDTSRALQAAEKMTPVFTIGANPENLLRGFEQLVPNTISQRWEQWHQTYNDLKARNPIFELCEMMHEIGETDQFSSWPYYQEEAIQDWIDSDAIKAMPFRDNKGIVTQAFYDRLRELRRSIGGWLYWKDTEDGVIFLREDEWQKLRLESATTEYLAGRGDRFRAQRS